MLRFKTKN